MKILIILILPFLLSNCCDIRAKGSLIDKNIKMKSVGNAPTYYYIPTNKGELIIDQDIGACGGGSIFSISNTFPFYLY